MILNSAVLQRLADSHGWLGDAWQIPPRVYLENGLMENLQAAALGLACLVMALCQMRSSLASRRYVAWSLFLVFLAMLVREVEIGPEASSAMIDSRGSETVCRVALGLACVATAVYGLTLQRASVRAALATLRGSRAWLTGGCLLYLAAWPMDKNVVAMPEHMALLFEEALECFATVCFLAASVQQWAGGRMSVSNDRRPVSGMSKSV